MVISRYGILTISTADDYAHVSALTQKLEKLTLELKEATSARNEAKGDLVGQTGGGAQRG